MNKVSITNNTKCSNNSNNNYKLGIVTKSRLHSKIKKESLIKIIIGIEFYYRML